MVDDETRASGFVLRLMENAALQGLSPLQKEEQILQFLRINAARLQPTLRSARFFPGRDWTQITGMLARSLGVEINRRLFGELEEMLRDRIDLIFLSRLGPVQVPLERCRTEILDFLKRLLVQPDARRASVGPHTAVRYGLADRYVDAVFGQRQYVHLELTKVQRLRLDRDGVKHMMNATLLLVPAIHLLTAGTSGSRGLSSGSVKPPFAAKVLSTLKGLLRSIPEPLLKSALNASVSFQESRGIEATARMAAIFAARGASYNPHLGTDRGAGTPDQSWFSIGRKNYRFHGFDGKMINEFYKIASENGW